MRRVLERAQGSNDIFSETLGTLDLFRPSLAMHNIVSGMVEVMILRLYNSTSPLEG